jgi:hypothetical protein
MPIAVGIMTDAWSDEAGVIVDISGSGMAFHALRSYRVGQRLHLRFRAPTVRFECRLLATVVRVDREPSRDRAALPYVTAVEFD